MYTALRHPVHKWRKMVLPFSIQWHGQMCPVPIALIVYILFLPTKKWIIIGPRDSPNINPKRAEGAESALLRHFLLYLSRLLFVRAETSWLFSFRSCAWFKTIFIKIGPRVMTRHCVIARWVQRKLIFHWNYTQIVFFVFFSGYTFTMFYLIYLVYLE